MSKDTKWKNKPNGKDEEHEKTTGNSQKSAL